MYFEFVVTVITALETIVRVLSVESIKVKLVEVDSSFLSSSSVLRVFTMVIKIYTLCSSRWACHT